MDAVETNIVLFQVLHSSKSTDAILADCCDSGVLLNAVGDRAFRLVTHLDVSREDIKAAGEVFARVLATR